ncbi:MAG: tyrosine-type recombinase/integrase [Alphaproteobacteria bacterium]
MDPDGAAALSYAQAQERARTWFGLCARGEADPGVIEGYTVGDAIAGYLKHYGTYGKALTEITYRANGHILPALGAAEVARLSSATLRTWFGALAASSPRLRTRPGQPQKYRCTADDPEAGRKRRSTANKILAILKAALNHAYREGRVASDTAWRRVTPYKGVDAARVRYLTEAECRRLVETCEPNFRNLVCAALLTGCRYGELRALRVADFDAPAGLVLVRVSKSGKPRHVALTAEGQDFFAQMTAGRPADATIFERPSGGPWRKSDQGRPMVAACAAANIVPAIGFHILRHTHASQLAMNAVPMMVIATQLGHSDTRMAEKHYAHMAPSYVVDTVRARFPVLGITGVGNVESVAIVATQ